MYGKNGKFQLSISKVIPARPKTIDVGMNTTTVKLELQANLQAGRRVHSHYQPKTLWEFVKSFKLDCIHISFLACTKAEL